MKYTYFAPDKSYVIQFFNNKNDITEELMERLKAIVGKYNPTIAENNGGAVGNDENTAKYFAQKFCWPVSIVKEPEFGIVCPAYPKNFHFGVDASKHLPLRGADKKSKWFTSKNRRYLNINELGNFKTMLEISLDVSTAVRRLHQAGLAHSDLSSNNVLIDPKTGTAVVIDIDSLVVPGIFHPAVAGTRNYIAPEVLETSELELKNPERKLPSVATDLHALAVLIYEYIFFRHPLIGPKIFSTESAEMDDFLAMGKEALFIEHPTDTSNRPEDLAITIKQTGVYLEELFLKAFVDGLHNPSARPTAMEWERALLHTLEQLHKCEYDDCLAKWYILSDPKHPICPFCGVKSFSREVVRLHLMSPIRGQTGQFYETNVINIHNNMPLYKRHVYTNCYKNEKSEDDILATITKLDGRWYLVNKNIPNMYSPKGNKVHHSGAIALDHNTIFMLSKSENGYCAECEIINV
ncbi:kinase [Clostridia bacterium]|nr:kinase [Clostridia bacterium]